ncbi:MAG: hypothetical protein M3340_18585, partial [Actinomycetota bacterium]|nr:hypothetical protein [Actinomycetota bacterium]
CGAARIGGTGGSGGNAGNGGRGGNAFGGAIYSDRPFEQSGNAFSNNRALAGDFGGASVGPFEPSGKAFSEAIAFSEDCCFAPGGKGGAGGVGGSGNPAAAAGSAGANGADGAKGELGEAGCGDLYPPDAGGDARAMATGPTCGCRLAQEVFGWKLEARCPSADALTTGIKGVTVTAPSGWQLSMPESNPTDYALPLEDLGALKLPVVLPDLNLTAGGLGLSAYENMLDHDGLRIGTGWFEVPRFKTEGLVEGLHVGEGFRGSADVVQLDLFDALTLEASDVQFSAQGLRAAQFEVGLPGLMGGAAVIGSNLEIGPSGVSGELTGAEIAIGDMTARFEEAKLTPNGISIGSATLKLPPYLGNATLEAKGVTWDSTTHELGVESARGDFEFTVAGRAKVEAALDFAFKPRGGFSLKGEGEFRIEGGKTPLFAAEAAIDVESVECVPAPGPCANGAFLHEAKLRIRPGKSIPLGQTGLALTDLGGSIKREQLDARRDADGNIHGVTYTVDLDTGIATAADNGFAFTGRIGGTASTNGNFAVGFRDATIFGYIRAYGEICARLVNEPDAVCDRLTRQDLARRPGTGVFAEGAAEARVSYGGRFFTARAELRVGLLGSVVNAGGETYMDAAVEGTLAAGADGWLLPDIQGSGRLLAEIGRFATPAGKSTLGVKGRVEATLRVRSIFGDREESIDRAIFIDRNGKYTEENVDGYTLGSARSNRVTSAAKRSRSHAFSIPAGQRQTMVVVDAKRGTPKLTLTAPGGMRVVATGSARGEPKLTVKRARGRKLDRKLAGRIFVVRSKAAGALSVYLPEPQRGRWSARVDGVKAGSYRFLASGNKPLPRLKITAPAKGKTLRATPAKPSVTLKGKLAGGPKKAAVSVYAGSAACVKRGGEMVPQSPGTLLGARVKVSKGAWSLKWNTAGIAPGRYYPYAVLANGSGARVGDCAKGSVVVGPETRR